MGTQDLALPRVQAGLGADSPGGRLTTKATAGYLAGSALVAALGAMVHSGPQTDALVAGAFLAALPWLLAASTESLLVLTVLALPFDTWKIWSVLSATNVLITIVVLRMVFDAARGVRRLRPSFAYRPLLAVGFAVVASTALAADRASAARLLVSVFGAGGFAVALVNYADRPQVRERLLDALFAASLVMSTTAIVQFIAYQYGRELWAPSAAYYVYNLGSYQIKASGLFNAPGNLSAYLLPGVACGLVLWGRPLPGVQRAIRNIATVLCVAASALTFTRASLLTIAVLGTGIAIAKLSSRLRHVWTAVLTAITLSAVAAIVAGPRLIAFLTAMSPFSVYSRASIYLGALDSFRAHPVFGTGLGAQVHQNWTNPELYDLASSVTSQDIGANTVAPRDTHSTPLQIAVDMGIVGLLAYGWLFAATFRRGVRAVRAPDQDDRAVAAAMLAATLGTLFVLLFNDGVAMKPLWMMLGLLWTLAPGASTAS